MYLLINTIDRRSKLVIFDTQRVIKDIDWISVNNHSEELLVKINQLLLNIKSSIGNVSGISVVTGPGSYTGIRVGVATANALSYSLKVPIVGDNILSLAARFFLLKMQSDKKIISIFKHAIHDQYYYAIFKENLGNMYKLKEGKKNKSDIDNSRSSCCIIGSLRKEETGANRIFNIDDKKFIKFLANNFSKKLENTKFSGIIVKPNYLNKPNITT
jgi:tRNA threonylcarbamoyladenosine biosynthesis protein TsaB